jgi:tRNA-specific 2-thiouridylase
MRVAELSWIGEGQRDVSVKVRSLAPPVAARLEDGWVVFARPEYGVAPGQAAVFYDGSRVLGGGWIAETRSAQVEAEAA